MWYDAVDDCGIVVSSRIRLARNSSDYLFSTKMTMDKAAELNGKVFGMFKKDTLVEEAGAFSYKNVNLMNDKNKLALLESHLISPLLAEKKEETGVILNKEKTVAVMVNEEDHFRIQAMFRGRCINKAYAAADEADKLLGKHFNYAYSGKYGFLTTCPTNLGTGMRASFMIHIPFLEAEKLIKSLSRELAVYGFTIKGIYGDGTDTKGSMYLISNQRTLGQSEGEILTALENICEQIIKQEKELRRRSLEHDRTGLEDRIFRAYGILKYARRINSRTAMEYLSMVRMGLSEGIISTSEKHNIHKLMIEIQPANMMLAAKRNMYSGERDEFRAQYIRSRIFALD